MGLNAPTWLTACAVADRNADDQVTIDELITAVTNALSGCPTPPGTPVVIGPTATPTATPSPP